MRVKEYSWRAWRQSSVCQKTTERQGVSVLWTRSWSRILLLLRLARLLGGPAARAPDGTQLLLGHVVGIELLDELACLEGGSKTHLSGPGAPDGPAVLVCQVGQWCWYGRWTSSAGMPDDPVVPVPSISGAAGMPAPRRLLTSSVAPVAIRWRILRASSSCCFMSCSSAESAVRLAAITCNRHVTVM